MTTTLQEVPMSYVNCMKHDTPLRSSRFWVLISTIMTPCILVDIYQVLEVTNFLNFRDRSQCKCSRFLCLTNAGCRIWHDSNLPSKCRSTSNHHRKCCRLQVTVLVPVPYRRGSSPDLHQTNIDFELQASLMRHPLDSFLRLKQHAAFKIRRSHSDVGKGSSLIVCDAV